MHWCSAVKGAPQRRGLVLSCGPGDEERGGGSIVRELDSVAG
jgi:hypothetical protein